MTEDITLPPLPKAHQKGCIYTGEQMRDYARAAVLPTKRAVPREERTMTTDDFVIYACAIVAILATIQWGW